MNSSQISRLAVIAVIAGSLLAVGVIAAISMAEEADAGNRISQSNSATVTQSGTSNSVTITQSNTATQSGGGSTVSQSSSTVCTNGDCTTTP
jgi:hypothetical protein